MDVTYDPTLVEEIATNFDQRDPNRQAMDELVKCLDGLPDGETIVADLATGVGKTYLMAGLIDYLAAQGARNVLVVTPGDTIQRKTIANFDSGSAKYIPGRETDPVVITPSTFEKGALAHVLRDRGQLKVFIFNIHQLIAPPEPREETQGTQKNPGRRMRRDDENLGGSLWDHLESAEDLYIITDEHHTYHSAAKAFHAAIRELKPRAVIGLTATPATGDNVVFEYTLGEAIADGYVKYPVIVYRNDGTKDERTQLRDACTLLRRKQEAYEHLRSQEPGLPQVNPCLFVVASDIEHCAEVGQMLAGPDFIGDGSAVLEITSQSSDEALAALAAVEDPASPIRAIVSVNKLREGWDVKNIAVIVALRKMASQTLTEQILGRGLRLPFGRLTGSPMVDSVDLVAHDSYETLLAQKGELTRRLMQPARDEETDDQGFLPTPPPSPEGSSSNPQPDDQTGDTQHTGGTGTTTDPDSDGDGDTGGLPNGDTLGFNTVDQQEATPLPVARNRMPDAPQIQFPRMESRLAPAPFSLAAIADASARKAGTNFVTEINVPIFRTAIKATRQGEDVALSEHQEENAEAQATLIGLDIVHATMVHAIMSFPEVEQTVTQRNGAKRLVDAFLVGAGASDTTVAAEWGTKRQELAINGLRTVIREAIRHRPKAAETYFKAFDFPIEPEHVLPNAPDTSGGYRLKTPIVGWNKNLMPSASFDAKTTEWALARILDTDPLIRWWGRVRNPGDILIRMETGGNYYPDFIAIDKDGTRWVIEGKSDKDATSAEVLAKKEAAERWARAVRDENDPRYGMWRYMFVTESHLRSANTFAMLLTVTTPE